MPFNLGLASAGDRSAPLGVTLDGTLTLVVQNDDALTYSVNWRLILTVVPHGGRPARSHSSWGCIGNHPDVCEWLCVGASFVLLLAGGLFSLGLNHGIPNAFRRLSLQRQLEPPLH